MIFETGLESKSQHTPPILTMPSLFQWKPPFWKVFFKRKMLQRIVQTPKTMVEIKTTPQVLTMPRLFQWKPPFKSVFFKPKMLQRQNIYLEPWSNTVSYMQDFKVLPIPLFHCTPRSRHKFIMRMHKTEPIIHCLLCYGWCCMWTD